MKLTNEVFECIIDDIESLCIEAGKIVITGSVALCAYGLKDEFNDVDVIVVDPDKDSYCELLYKYYQEKNGYSLCKVRDKTFPIDILRDDYLFENPIIQVRDNIYLSKIEDIIHAKRQLGRTKDVSDFAIMIDRLKVICGANNKE